MAGKQKVTDVQVETATQIYDAAQTAAGIEIAKLQGEMEAVRSESRAMGILQKIDYDIAHNEFLKLMVLHRVKQSKDYKSGGLTWAEFCEAVGTPQRSADRMIEEVTPLFEKFSANLADFCGMPFSKIRYLGQAVSANLADFEENCLVYGGQKIPLTPEHKDDIEMILDLLQQEVKLRSKEAEDQQKANKRVLQDKETLLNKQAKDLARFDRKAREKGLSPEEDAILGKIETLGIELNGYCLSIENVRDALLENPFPNAVAAFIALAENVKMKVSAFRESAAEVAPAGMIEDDWTPPPMRAAGE